MSIFLQNPKQLFSSVNTRILVKLSSFVEIKTSKLDNCKLYIHTCNKLWTEIHEVNQNFKGDLIKLCKISTKIALELPQNNPF